MTIIKALRPASLTRHILAITAVGSGLSIVAPAAASPLSVLPHAALASFAATAAPSMIPEPASAALLIVGLTISAVAARRRRPRAKPRDPLLP